MEFILENTDILDLNLAEKLESLLKNERMEIVENKYYDLTISFNEKFLICDKMQRYIENNNSSIDVGRMNDDDDELYKEIINKLLNNILQLVKKSLYNILNIDESKLYQSSIEGTSLESERIIKIKIQEAAPVYYGRGKKKSLMRVTTVVPSVSYISKTLNKYISKDFAEMFVKLHDLSGSKIMSELLDIQHTTDINELYSIFIVKYGREYQKSYLSQENTFCEMFLKELEEVYKKYERNND